MLPELEYTDTDELGYYLTFGELFSAFNSHAKKDKNKNLIEINFSFTDEDTAPSEAQKNAHEFLLKHANEMLAQILQYLKQDEEYFMEFYGIYNEITQCISSTEDRTYTNKEGFPIVDKYEDYLNYFEISSINISDSEEDDFAFIGFTGSSSWDSEHGLGISFYKSELLHVGDWDYGRHPSWGKNDKKNLLTNYFTDFHLLEPLTSLKSRLANSAKNITSENDASYKELFDWLLKHKMIYGYRNTTCDLNVSEKRVLLNEIKELSFYGNKISLIPESIGLLENLTSLSFSFNKMKTFPLQIIQLKKLKELVIIGNEIENIPSKIKELVNLKSLRVNQSKLQNIPEEIGLLSKLNYLDISSNQLTDLPNSLSHLKELKNLDLSYNLHTEIPSVVFNIQNLKELDISSNQLTNITIPDTQINALEKLYLGFNQIVKLSESLFSQISNLKHFKIAVNRISLENLEYLKNVIPSEIDHDFDSAISCAQDSLSRENENTNKWWKFWN
ncbi:leucine-rich repeat domain-containing protein [uncultured Tenacibaculum sp.]|uniref:leucine-rich repeat domain-containing protein n=1 Tax=uncultured Tenacibaculum sp. TaxID=174713 RepID=UPI002617F6D8|nr:leucine-rich repeat domain-containing protein [uncultured Tenacibaculum sp.]